MLKRFVKPIRDNSLLILVEGAKRQRRKPEQHCSRRVGGAFSGGAKPHGLSDTGDAQMV